MCFLQGRAFLRMPTTEPAVLEPLSAARAKGFAFLKVSLNASAKAPLVSTLASERPTLQTEYLLGAEPHWADIVQGRAVHRSHDESLRGTALEIVKKASAKTLLAVTGTAGTGKSTAMMGLAVELSNAALPVYWLDKDSMVPLSTVRRQIEEADDGVVLAIDDADLYGSSLPGLIEDILSMKERVLVVIGVRSNKLDQVIGPIERGKRMHVKIHTVPYLTDDDVDGLIAVLDKHNRLGKLKGLGNAERREAFTRRAGRQLLVAMIEATSGQKFTEKAQVEMTELDPVRRRVYGLICLASASRHYVTKEDIILASGDSSNESLAALDQLVSRHLVYAHPPGHKIKARHRMIADLVVDKLREDGELSDVVRALAWAVASQAYSEHDRQGRIRRMLSRFTNHEFLLPLIGVMDTRALYEDLEQLLTSDYHYWLQRGSLEVQNGDISRAENFLGQALSMAPHDYRVENAYGYMKIRKAWEAPKSVEAREYLEEGIAILQDIIDRHGREDSYAFHILGSQSLNWARKAWLPPHEKRHFLERTLATLDRGVRLHSHNPKLVELKQEVHKEILSTVVATQN